MPSESGDRDAPGQPHASVNQVHPTDHAQAVSLNHNDASNKDHANGDAQQSGSNPPTPPAANQDEKARGRKTSRAAEPFDEAEREEMERLLQELRGHLGRAPLVYMRCCFDAVSSVLYPTRFLEGEDAANNFLFNADRYAVSD